MKKLFSFTGDGRWVDSALPPEQLASLDGFVSETPQIVIASGHGSAGWELNGHLDGRFGTAVFRRRLRRQRQSRDERR